MNSASLVLVKQLLFKLIDLAFNLIDWYLDCVGFWVVEYCPWLHFTPHEIILQILWFLLPHQPHCIVFIISIFTYIFRKKSVPPNVYQNKSQTFMPCLLQILSNASNCLWHNILSTSWTWYKLFLIWSQYT